MFTLALVIGIYSYTIFFLGIVRFLTAQILAVTTFLYIVITIFLFNKTMYSFFFQFRNAINNYRKGPPFSLFGPLLLILVALQVGVNFIGALGPELAFDSLWYHLTLPKLYLLSHTISFIPGGLFYYSTMPKLVEMLYTSSLALSNEIIAKTIHFTFGLLCCVVLYKVARIYVTKFYSLLAVVLFYSNLVVDWLSITAYVDLGRTFFELLALLALLYWSEKKENKWFFMSAAMLGFTVATKILALESFTIFLLLIFIIGIQKRIKLRKLFLLLLQYTIIVFVVILPWLLFSYTTTGNPLYPFFSKTYQVHLHSFLVNPLEFVNYFYNFFTASSDPISPVYIIFLPFIVIWYKKFDFQFKILLLYVALGLLLGYIIPQTGGTRFFLSFLAVFAILIVKLLCDVKNTNEKYNILIATFTIYLIITTAIFSIFYRTAANAKYLPVIIGVESRDTFLSHNLNFSFGDFYDIDKYFSNNIKKTDIVLLYGFHNLYYIDFPFIDSSWVKKGDMFNYIATQNTSLPNRFKNWKPIYQNSTTHVILYTLDYQKWQY